MVGKHVNKNNDNKNSYFYIYNRYFKCQIKLKRCKQTLKHFLEHDSIYQLKGAMNTGKNNSIFSENINISH